MEKLLLKALREEGFGHEFQQMSSFLVVTCINLNAGKLKTLTHIVDKKQVRIKDVIIIISSLNKSHKLLVIEVLKLVSLNSARH